MEEAACLMCPYGSTTLQEGAVGSTSCKCMPGFVNASSSQSHCEPCGFGFFCIGGTHREPCAESQATLVNAASDRSQCLCAAGTYVEDAACVPCAAGHYKNNVGNVPCSPCAAGTWSNTTGAAGEETCHACVPGSTTEAAGSGHEDLCVRPHDGQQVQCTSGRACSIQLNGFHLRDGHRLALTKSGDCGAANLPVAGISNDGMSEPASTGNYLWGDIPAEFIPEGGIYRLCWCANMPGLACPGLESFQLSAGLLHVAGPSGDHLFHCVRGQDCTGLSPFRGEGLSPLDRVSIRTGGCGSTVLQISPANVEGSAVLESFESTFSMHFGSSNAGLGLDHGVFVDASEGYDLCWCGGPLCSQEDFVVPAGKLQVKGPHVNQEISCFVGQPCVLTGIPFVEAAAGDLVMVLSACGTGSAVQGFPGGGIAEYAEYAEARFGLFQGNLFDSNQGVVCCSYACRCDPAKSTHTLQC